MHWKNPISVCTPLFAMCAARDDVDDDDDDCDFAMLFSGYDSRSF